MKIQELRLLAVGPFTALTLDLSGGRQGFHLVYGANEAGKSSALRAIRYLLFGFPQRLEDDFVHPYNALRVGASIIGDQGETLSITRRKANQRSLRDEQDDEEVDEERLRTALGRVSEELFTRSFGIDHPALVRGGQEIVRGEGELGRLLFSGSGIAHLRDLENCLESELKERFLASAHASKPQVNRLLRELKEARQLVRGNLLRPAEWKRHYEALQQARQQQAQLESERGQKRGERDRLERYRAALPRISVYRDLESEAAELTDAPLLPRDFNRRRESTMRELNSAETSRDTAEAEIRQRQEGLDQLDVPEQVLACGHHLDGLEKELHRYQHAQADRPTVEATLRSLEREAQAVLDELGEPAQLEQAQSLLLPKAERTRIQQLAAAYSLLIQAVDDGRIQVEQLDAERAEVERQLQDTPAPEDPTPLRQALAGALKLGDIERDWEQTRESVETEAAEAERELQRLPGWPGTLAEVEVLRLPVAATIEDYEDRFRELDDGLKRIETRIQQVEEAGHELARELDLLRAEQEIPTEAQLRDLRHQRDQVWQAIRQALHRASQDASSADGLPEGEGGTLEATYEQLVAAADTVSDRLRHEADRVARHAQLSANMDRTNGELERLAQQREEIVAGRERLDDEWRRLWAELRVEPRSPREMRAWHQQWTTLVGRARALRESRHKEHGLAERVASERQRLVRALTATGQMPSDDLSLPELIDLAEQTLEAISDAASHRHDLTRDRQRLEQSRQRQTQSQAEANEKLQRWQSEWQAVAARLPRRSAETPEIANQTLEMLHQLRLKLANAEQQRDRLREIDDFSRDFEQRVRDLAGQLAGVGTEDRPAGEAAARLLDHYRRARELEKERRRLQKELTERRTLHEQAVAALRDHQAALEQLCREAGCASADDLLAAWERADRKRQVQEALENLRRELSQLSGGVGFEPFVAAASSEDPDLLGIRVEQLEREVQQLDDQLVNEIGQTIGSEQRVLEGMDSSGAAAEAEETARDVLADLSAAAHEYAVLRLAQLALQYGIERYRDRHQVPLLRVAGATFGKLTAGSFQGLKVDYDADGTPTLMGVRATSGESVPVTGMSDGTADQLYFALRYASLASYLETHESLPFVVDDILIRFDNERARRTLEVLAELSARTQVLFFTHHWHLVEFARDLLPADVLFVHELPRATQSC